ncbi:MAG TPA: hypothetical protein VLH79_16425 [Chthonomonadales bacterium]|nr:hypothetical protein [Chthonomonadales bacterium]
MLIYNVRDSSLLERATLLMEPHEALELMEKLAHLVRRPDYHHDHIESPDAVLDISVVLPNSAPTYSAALRPYVDAYLARSQSGP